MTIIATTGTGGLQGMLVSLLPLVGLMAIMYFMLMRPEKKRKQAYQDMLSTLAVNDEIVTRGGIAGKIIRLDEDYMVIESGPDRTRIRLIRDSVFKKVSREEAVPKMEG